MALLEHAYSLEDSLSYRTEDSASARFLHTCAPGEAAREELIAKKLGVNGWGRWQYFRSCFSGSWGEGTQKPFSPRSQDMLFKALAKIEFPQGLRPSLFLTDDGNCELAWRNEGGAAVQIEFGPREFELYIESDGVEESHPNQDLDGVLAKYLKTAV